MNRNTITKIKDTMEAPIRRYIQGVCFGKLKIFSMNTKYMPLLRTCLDLSQRLLQSIQTGKRCPREKRTKHQTTPKIPDEITIVFLFVSLLAYFATVLERLSVKAQGVTLNSPRELACSTDLVFLVKFQ